MPETRSICAAVSIQYRPVTDNVHALIIGLFTFRLVALKSLLLVCVTRIAGQMLRYRGIRAV